VRAINTRLALTIVAALAAALCLVAAAPAAADSISYIKDGNIWLSTPDGSRQYQVTKSGGYSYASQADDGTLIGLHGRRLHRIDRHGNVLADFATPVSLDTGPNDSHFQGPFDPAISPDGTKVAYTYYWQYYGYDPTCNGGTGCIRERLEQGVGYSHADRLTGWDEPGLGRQSGWVDPSWIGNTQTLLTDPSVPLNLDSVVDTVGDGTGNVEQWFSDNNAWHLEDGEISRDNAKAAFVGQPPSQDAFRGDIIAIYRMNGPAPALPEACYHYTEPDGAYDSPSFSPDGSRIAFAQHQAGNPGIFVGEVPSFAGGCQLPAAGGTMIIPGGAEPDWGPADVPTANDIVVTPPDDRKADVKAACGTLKSAAKRDKCLYKAAVAKCKASAKGKKRARCIRKARRAYAVKKCQRTATGQARKRCIAKARRA
jgi:WD40-like Beta Propeller Repeat